MNASNRTAVEAAAIEIVQERVEVNHDRVAEALAREIVNEHIDSLEPADAIEAGVKAAIDGIDQDVFTMAVEVINDRVTAEVEGQAKCLALAMLRAAAVKAERAMQATAGAL
jgi:hypothetical protein